MSESIELKITGMTCGHCVAHTKKSLEAVPGVSQVEVSLDPGSAKVSGEHLDTQALVDAVKQAGYEAQAV